jgi:Na+-transporting NADH:ubiquinone oxidoreductase subunit NqrC
MKRAAGFIYVLFILANVSCGNMIYDIQDEISRNRFHGIKQLTAGDGLTTDLFGVSVSVSADGNTVVAGAYYDDIGSNADQGSAWIFAD